MNKTIKKVKKYRSMEKTYKRVPFNLELAKKIQYGEVEGRIVTNEGNDVEIIRFNLIQNSFPILAIIRFPNVVSDYWEDAKLFQLNGRHGNEKLWLEIELPEEAQKHEFKVGDKVRIRAKICPENAMYDGEIGEVTDVLENVLHIRVKALPFAYLKEECELIESVESKYEFKPFDKVLVRMNNDCYWVPRFFHRMEDGMCRDTNGSLSAQCIPYEGNEHLVGTSDNPE